MCVLLVLVAQLNFFISEFCLIKNTGVLFCPSSPIFGELAFFLKCLVSGTQGTTSVSPAHYQKQTVFATAERVLMRTVLFVAILIVLLLPFIYHVSRLKAFQKLGTALTAEPYPSTKGQGKQQKTVQVSPTQQ